MNITKKLLIGAAVLLAGGFANGIPTFRNQPVQVCPWSIAFPDGRTEFYENQRDGCFKAYREIGFFINEGEFIETADNLNGPWIRLDIQKHMQNWFEIDRSEPVRFFRLMSEPTPIPTKVID